MRKRWFGFIELKIENKMRAKIILAVVGCVICLCVGFLFGRSTSKVETRVEYIREPAVSGVVHNITPTKEVVPISSVLPMVRDTVYVDRVRYILERVDTAAIIAEYELRRTYELPVFDNQYGRLDLTLDMQYNRLDTVRFEFAPIRTIQTVRFEQKWAPFVSASYLTIGYAGVGGGFFYHSLGMEYQRLIPVTLNGSGGNMLGLRWKF